MKKKPTYPLQQLDAARKGYRILINQSLTDVLSAINKTVLLIELAAVSPLPARRTDIILRLQRQVAGTIENLHVDALEAGQELPRLVARNATLADTMRP